MRKLAIAVTGVILLLALVALALGGPDRSAQADHRGGSCSIEVPHLFMTPATTIQPIQLETFSPPTNVTATLTFNRAIADTIPLHGLQFMSMTGPGLNTPATSFGPVTNGDKTIEINFSGAAVAAALDAALANAGQLQANVDLTVHGHWFSQPHLFDVSENVCPIHAEGTDTILAVRLELAIEKTLLTNTKAVVCDDPGVIDCVVETDCTEIGIYLLKATRCVFEIAYSNPNPDTPVRIIDAIPAEFELALGDNDCEQVCDFVSNPVASAGEVKVIERGRAADRIEWDLPAGTTTATLTVTVQTVANPGHRFPVVFKPTSCGPLPINPGATAYEVDPETGKIVKVPVLDGDGASVLDSDGEPVLVAVIVVGPSNSLVVEAVEGAKPCEEG